MHVVTLFLTKETTCIQSLVFSLFNIPYHDNSNLNNYDNIQWKQGTSFAVTKGKYYSIITPYNISSDASGFVVTSGSMSEPIFRNSAVELYNFYVKATSTTIATRLEVVLAEL